MGNTCNGSGGEGRPIFAVLKAIRLVRGACDLGLKDAKDIVDHFTAVIHGCENYEAYLRATVR
jgi:hypothetical protein